MSVCLSVWRKKRLRKLSQGKGTVNIGAQGGKKEGQMGSKNVLEGGREDRFSERMARKGKKKTLEAIG